MKYIVIGVCLLLILAFVFAFGYLFRRNNPDLEKKAADKAVKKVTEIKDKL